MTVNKREFCFSEGTPKTVLGIRQKNPKSVSLWTLKKKNENQTLTKKSSDWLVRYCSLITTESMIKIMEERKNRHLVVFILISS